MSVFLSLGSTVVVTVSQNPDDKSLFNFFLKVIFLHTVHTFVMRTNIYCNDHQVYRIVFSSSATVYGVPEYLPLDEKHRYRMI